MELAEKPKTELTLPQRAAVALGSSEHEIKLRELVKSIAEAKRMQEEAADAERARQAHAEQERMDALQREADQAAIELAASERRNTLQVESALVELAEASQAEDLARCNTAGEVSAIDTWPEVIYLQDPDYGDIDYRNCSNRVTWNDSELSISVKYIRADLVAKMIAEAKA